MLLDDDEAVAVAIGLRAEALGTIAGLGEASLRALTKLERLLPARLRHIVTTLHEATVPLAAATSTVDTDVLMTIAAACRDSEQLRVDYQSRGGGRTARRVEPHRMVNTGNRWYLVARDVQRADWRTFRVDRISAVPVPGPGPAGGRPDSRCAARAAHCGQPDRRPGRHGPHHGL